MHTGIQCNIILVLVAKKLFHSGICQEILDIIKSLMFHEMLMIKYNNVLFLSVVVKKYYDLIIEHFV